MKRLLKQMQINFNLFRPKKIIDTLFSVFLVVIIIAIIFLGVFFSYMFSNNITEQMKKNGSYAIEQHLNNTGRNFEFVLNTAYNLMWEEAIFSLPKYAENSTERVSSYKEVKTVLSRTEYQNDILEEIYLYYQNENIAFNSDASINDSAWISDEFGMDKDTFNEYIIMHNGEFVVLDNGVDGESIVYIKSIDKKLAAGNIFAIFVLNSNNITNSISARNYDENSLTFLIDKYDNYLIGYSEHKGELSETEIVEEYLALNIKDKYSEEKIGGKSYAFFLDEILLTDTRILFVIDKANYVKDIMSVWEYIFAISLFTLLLGMFVWRIYSIRIYRPIKNLIDIFRPVDSDYGSKSEIKFIEEKYIELTKLQSEIGILKEDRRQSVRRMELLAFLKESTRDYDGVIQMLEDLDVHLKFNYYTIALIKIDNFDRSSKKNQYQQFREFVCENIISKLNDICPYTEQGTYEFFDGGYIGLLIGHKVIIDFEKTFHAIAQYLYNDLDLRLSVIISKMEKMPEHLGETYKNVFEFMNQMRLYKNGFILNQEWLSQQKNVNKSFVNDKRIYTLIKQGIDNNAEHFAQLDEVIDDLLLKDTVFYSDVNFIFIRILKVLFDLAEESGMGEELNIEARVNPNIVDDIGEIEEVAVYIKTLCRGVITDIAQRSKGRNQAYERIMEFISQNYMKEISLSDMSDSFGLSKNYFSKYVKEITGKNYIDLLNSYRIEKAKELIDNDMSLKLFQVAELVGFANYKTFSTAFKKYDGQSPEIYRNNGKC